jgi:hypothetical protein
MLQSSEKGHKKKKEQMVVGCDGGATKTDAKE